MFTNIFSVPGHDPHSGFGEQSQEYDMNSGVQQEGNEEAHGH